MKNSRPPLHLEKNQPPLSVTRVAFRRRVEAQLAELPQQLFGLKKNSFKIRLSSRFILLLLRKGLHLKSSTKEIQTFLEKMLYTPLSRILSCGQLRFGDVLMVRTDGTNQEIEITRLNRRGKVAAE